MTTLSKDEVIAWALEAGFMSAEFWPDDFKGLHATVERFATLCRADLVAENERLASLAKEYRDNGDRLLDVTDSLKAELSALRAGSGEAVKPLPGADWTITMRRMMAGGCSKRKCTCKAGNEQNCIWWDEPGDAPQPSAVKQEAVALEKVYETIIEWDERGGKRSRRELARRICNLHPQPSAVPVVEKLVEALKKAHETTYSDTLEVMFRESIVTGQQWLKECGE